MSDAPMRGSTLDVDCACMRCDYNLRGLHAEGLCPECAAPVSVSLAQDLLQFAAPGWVKTLLLGSRLVIAAALLIVVTPALMLLSMLFTRAESPSTRLAAAAFPLALLLAIWGCWCLTSPNAAAYENSWTWRRQARVLLVITALLCTAMIFAPAVVWGFPGAARFAWVQVVLTVLTGWALLLYFGGLARRIRATALARRASIARRVLLASALVLGVGTMAVGFVPVPPSWLAAIVMAAGLFVVVCVALSALFPAYFHAHLREAVAAARRELAERAPTGEALRRDQIAG